MINKLLVAKADEAEAIPRAPNGYESVVVRGLQPEHLCALHAALQKIDPDDIADAYEPVVEVSDNGPWVFPVPKVLLGLVRSIDANAEAEKLRATEYFDTWNAADVAALITHLQTLAAKAESIQATVFLWVSL